MNVFPTSTSRFFLPVAGFVLFAGFASSVCPCQSVCGADAVFPARTLFRDIRDDTALFRTPERPALEGALRFLRDASEADIAGRRFATVSYLQLAAQSEAYRGKLVTISGTFLRSEAVDVLSRKLREFPVRPFSEQDSQEADFPVTRYHDCWIRMDDQTSKPLSVVALDIPEKPVSGERVHVLGLFFKRRLYTDGGELLATPMILAKSIRRGAAPEVASGDKANGYRIVTENSVENAVVKREHTDVLPDELSVRDVLGLSEQEWLRLEAVNSEDSANSANDFRSSFSKATRETLEKLLRRLRQRHVFRLVNAGSTRIPVGDAPYPESGTAVSVSRKTILQRIRTIPSSAHSAPLYLCEVKLEDDSRAYCIVPHIPAAWRTDAAPQDATEQENTVARRDHVSFVGIAISRRPDPIVLAPKLQWYPEDRLLGKYGMDMATLDAVAPLPIDRLLRKNPPDERRSAATTSEPFDLNRLRFTEADHEPFYLMLTTAAKIPPEEIDRNIASELEKKRSDHTPVIDLFNRPHTQQGRLVRLRGNARRIDRVLVDDPDVQARFHLDHYYQITFFTPDSQGNPLVCCLRNIPEGLPLGSETEFNVPISLSGFFYKTWAYRKLAPPDDARSDAAQSERRHIPGGAEKSGNAPSREQFAPLIIGAKIDWFQPPTDPGRDSGGPFPFFRSTFVFLVLVLVWIMLRRLGPKTGSPAVRFR